MTDSRTGILRQGVTQEECGRKHNATRWVIGVLVGLMGLFSAAAVWSASVGHRSINAWDAHEQRQQVIEKHWTQDIIEIKAELKYLRGMVEDLLREQKNNNSSS